MACSGFPADAYDRYVLGLLEEPERSQLEAQIQDQCPECIRSVQRSMNLWLVFATTLENAEPSADFRARLIRIAELSRKVLTFPKNSGVRERTNILTSTLIVICAALAVLLLTTWYAGRQSLRLDSQPASADINRLAQQLATAQIELKKENAKRTQVENQLNSSGQAALGQVEKMKRTLSESQATEQQYKEIIERDRAQMRENTSLIEALASGGARLLVFKGVESAAKGTVAYVLVINNAKLVFIGSNLPKLEADHQFQLWLVRTEDPKYVSAGVFAPDDHNRAVVRYDEAALISAVSELTITAEPTGGSSGPTGPKLLEVSTLED
ncbi:MAG TPA: anti-sigma factor [Bryobacteraceae bacterium]|jgi:anti-sigma-K factor RskA